MILEVKAHLVELLDDFFERLLTEVSDLDHLIHRLGDKIADRIDLCPLEAVVCTDGEIQVFDDAGELGIMLAGLLYVLEAQSRISISKSCEELEVIYKAVGS